MKERAYKRLNQPTGHFLNKKIRLLIKYSYVLKHISKTFINFAAFYRGKNNEEDVDNVLRFPSSGKIKR